MPTNASLAVGFIGTLYIIFSALLHFTQDAKEPPAIGTGIPFLSPIIGQMRNMTDYFIRLRNLYNVEIYTLRMPGQRIYVVDSLPLIGQVQRHTKEISFMPVQASAAANVFGVGPAGSAIIGSGKMLESGSYLSTFVPSISPALAPGPGLDALNRAAIEYIAGSLDTICSGGSKRAPIDLYEWARNIMFQATTESIYGPQNPLRPAEVEKAWYDFEPGIMIHMLKAMPSVLARKSTRARDRVLIPAFEKYFADDGHKKGSLLVQCRHEHNTSHGLRGRDVAATEVGQMIASLTNSMASAFWMIYFVFSNPTIQAECRDEVEKLVASTADGCSIDLSRVKSECPILLSTWHETLRYVHIGVSARVVMEDVMLDNRFLLKKGATVMSIAPVVHSDLSLWGPTRGDFDHKRFMRKTGEKRTHPAAFRGFGGGAVLCPGRHFVSTEVLSVVALLLLRFNIKPQDPSGRWAVPIRDIPMTSSMPTPRNAVPVVIEPRDERKWRVTFSDSGKGVAMMTDES